MTEKDYWLRLAELWDHPQESSRGVHVKIGVLPCKGLCACVDDILLNEYKIWESMRQKIQDLAPPGTNFKWPLNLEGAKSRAEFCRKMAEECK